MKRTQRHNPRVGEQKAPLTLMAPDMPSAQELLPWLRKIDAAGWYTNFGPLAKRLEQELGRLIDPENPPHMVSASSGTQALILALLAEDLPARSRVLVPAFTFPATVEAVRAVGCEPVFADVDDINWNLTPAIAREALVAMPDIRLVMPVTAFGCPQPTAAWRAFARDTGVAVVMDAAAALGHQASGEGLTVCYSLHATKPFGVGEGGMIATHDEARADKLKRLSNFGIQGGELVEQGINGKMSEYHAAVGLAQLKRWTVKKAALLSLYHAYAHVLDELPDIRMQAEGVAWVRASLVVRARDDSAQRYMRALEKRSIPTRQWYAPALHQTDVFAGYARLSDYLPVAESLARQTFALPFHRYLEPSQVLRICDVLRHA